MKKFKVNFILGGGNILSVKCNQYKINTGKAGEILGWSVQDADKTFACDISKVLAISVQKRFLLFWYK
jgi:hypothetical protein